MKYITTVKNHEYIIEIDQENLITVNGEPYQVDFQQLEEGGVLSLILNNRSWEAIVEERDDSWDVLILGELYSVKVQDERAYRLAKARSGKVEVTGEAHIKSPMPGVIIAVPVLEGQLVKKGERLVILESMKMENELRSPREGIVKRVLTEAGATVEKDQVLIVVGDSHTAEAQTP